MVSGKKTAPSGFFQRFFGFLSESSPEQEKKRLLKDLARRCKRLKTRRYNPKGDLAESALARFFFEIYKTVGPAQGILSHADSSKALRTILIETALSEEQLAFKERFSDDSILERSKTTEGKQLIEELKADLKTFYSYFDISKINEINFNNKHLSTLIKLVNFDYYFLLRKFDAQLPEGDFNYIPKFEGISAQYISDELKNYLEILPAVDPAAN
jgi:hypothetical protein